MYQHQRTENRNWSLVPLDPGVGLEAQAGQTSDREVYIGQGWLKHDGGTSHLDRDWIFGLNLNAEF